MGRLINMLKAFHSDDDLIKILRSVKKDRDHLAHKGYLAFELGEERKHLVQKEINKIKNTVNKSNVVLARLRVIKADLHNKIEQSKNA